MTEHRPWLKSYPEGVPRTLEPYPEKSLFSLLEESAKRFPDRPAIAWFGRHITYKELLRETDRFITARVVRDIERRGKLGRKHAWRAYRDLAVPSLLHHFREVRYGSRAQPV